MHLCCSWISLQSPQPATFWNWVFKPINNSAVTMMISAFGHISPASESWWIFLKILFIMKNFSRAFWWLEKWINSSLITLETQTFLCVGTKVRLHSSVGMTSGWVSYPLNPVFFSLSVFLLGNKWKTAVTPPTFLLWLKWIPPWGRACGMMESFYTHSPLTIQLILYSPRLV